MAEKEITEEISFVYIELEFYILRDFDKDNVHLGAIAPPGPLSYATIRGHDPLAPNLAKPLNTPCSL